ncbi:MAG: DUF885 domain-containing protein [Planctomycetaceae bacterium]|nr:DUF885 domain-containing protein [Planctomycetaceae bacterium]
MRIPLTIRVLLLSLICLLGGNTRLMAEPAQEFHKLLDEHWEWQMKTDPIEASSLGDLRYNHLWPDRSLQAYEASHQQLGEFLKQLMAIDETQLTGEDRISYQLFQRKLEMEREGYGYDWHLVPMDQLWGIQNQNELGDKLRFEKVKHYEDWLSRLKTFGTFMDQTITLMQTGADRRIVHARVVMQRVPSQISKQIVDDPQQSLFFNPFRSYHSSISKEDQQRLTQEAEAAIRDVVVPAYQRFDKFFREIYLPACFEEVGVRQIPQGQEFYAYRARLFTTTDMTPQQIHDIGMSEVKRIRKEMEKIMQEVQFEGSFSEFLEHLRTDRQFYYDNAEDLFEAVQAVCKRIDPELVRLFKTLPRMPYGVKPIPEATAPNTTAAYYMEPAADGSRAGNYYFNLYKPEQRPKYTLEALSLHEAVPGHHLQIALAMELEDLPAFRRFGGYTAFIEGWGLYSESLGSDLGLYKDPYSRMGQLTYEMWRAIRLVVDTGMHSLGWTREQAIDLFVNNSAKSRLDIENEVDRYIAWPGQALAYKIGELKIQELRRRSEKALGEEFDIREFHDEVLKHGAVTLEVLERQIDDWIKSKSTANS